MTAIVGIWTVVATATLLERQHRLTQVRAEFDRFREQQGHRSAASEGTARSQAVSALDEELDRLRRSHQATQAELVRLRGRAGESLRVEAENARLRTDLERQAENTQRASNGFAAPMVELMRAGMERAQNARLARMRDRLQLTADQTAAIADILGRKAQAMAEGARGALTGQLDRQKLARFRQECGDPEAQISALLSPEQQTAYAAFQQEERVEGARKGAESELLNLRRSLELTAGQQGPVYAALFEEACQAPPAGSEGNSAENPVAEMQAAFDRRLLALKSVLTPVQWENYRQQQERQLNLMKAMVANLEPLPPGSGD